MPIDVGGNPDRPGTGATTERVVRIESGAPRTWETAERPGLVESHAVGIAQPSTR